jgi:hypothetical protein
VEERCGSGRRRPIARVDALLPAPVTPVEDDALAPPEVTSCFGPDQLAPTLGVTGVVRVIERDAAYPQRPLVQGEPDRATLGGDALCDRRLSGPDDATENVCNRLLRRRGGRRTRCPTMHDASIIALVAGLSPHEPGVAVPL